jgi:TetR/AcrR family transcriptional repressor of nem operon
LLAARRPGEPKKALQRRAVAIFAAVEGAQLIARGRKDIAAFDEIVETYRAVGLFG